MPRCFTQSRIDEGTTLDADSSVVQSQDDRRQNHRGKIITIGRVVLRSFTHRTYIQPISRHHFTCLRFADPVQNPSRRYCTWRFYYFYVTMCHQRRTTTLTMSNTVRRRCVFAYTPNKNDMMLETYCNVRISRLTREIFKNIKLLHFYIVFMSMFI